MLRRPFGAPYKALSINNIAIFRVVKMPTLKMVILLSINVLCAALFVSSKLGNGMALMVQACKAKKFPNHITRFVQEELPSYSVLRTSTTKVIPIKTASWIANQLEVGLRSDH